MGFAPSCQERPKWGCLAFYLREVEGNHTSGQVSGVEETLRGLTSPGKTTVRQETHRQRWLALEIRTRVLAPFPLGAINQYKENPHDTRPASLRHLGPSRQSGLVDCLLTSLTATEVKPQTTGPNITFSMSLTALSEWFALFCHYFPTPSKVQLGIITVCFPEGKDLFSFTT